MANFWDGVFKATPATLLVLAGIVFIFIALLISRFDIRGIVSDPTARGRFGSLIVGVILLVVGVGLYIFTTLEDRQDSIRADVEGTITALAKVSPTAAILGTTPALTNVAPTISPKGDSPVTTQSVSTSQPTAANTPEPTHQAPTNTPVPATNTAVPPTNTLPPLPTNTPKPQPTNTPAPPPPAGQVYLEETYTKSSLKLSDNWIRTSGQEWGWDGTGFRPEGTRGSHSVITTRDAFKARIRIELSVYDYGSVRIWFDLTDPAAPTTYNPAKSSSSNYVWIIADSNGSCYVNFVAAISKDQHLRDGQIDQGQYCDPQKSPQDQKLIIDVDQNNLLTISGGQNSSILKGSNVQIPSTFNGGRIALDLSSLAYIKIWSPIP